MNRGVLAASSGRPGERAREVGQQLRMGPVEWALLVLHSILWGSAFFLVAVALAELPPISVATLRLFPAAATLALVSIALGLRFPATVREWRRFLLLAAFNNFIPFVLIAFGQLEVTGGLAAIFNATAPLFAVLIAHVVTTDDRLTPAKVVGILMGIAGVAVLVAPAIGGGASLAAYAALLAAPLCYAIAGNYARRLGGYPPIMVSTAQMTGALVLSVPTMLIVDRPWSLPMPSLTTWGALGALGLLASAAASMVYFTILRRAGATNALLVTLIMPLTPIVLGGAFLSERITAREAIGALVIGAALVIIDGRVIKSAARVLGTQRRGGE